MGRFVYPVFCFNTVICEADAFKIYGNKSKDFLSPKFFYYYEPFTYMHSVHVQNK